MAEERGGRTSATWERTAEGAQPNGDLVRAEQLLRARADNAPVAVVEFDTQPRVTRWAASAERMLGYPAEEMVGKSVDEMHWVDDEGRRRAEAEFAGILDRSRTQAVATNRQYRKDGSIIWCECYTSAIEDEEGNLVAVLGLLLDITERKQAEERARQELENTRTLLDTAAALASGRSLHDVLDALCDAVLRALSHKRVIVSLWDEADRAIVTMVSKGVEPVSPGERIRIDDLTGPGRHVLEDRVPAVIDYDRVPPGPASRAGRVPSHIALGVPLVSGERLVGLLTIDDPEQRREFTERDVELAEGIASQASVAIENARLLEDERERIRFADALASVDLAIHASLEWGEIATRALAETSAALGVDAATILTHEGPSWVVTEVYGFEPSPSGERFEEDAALRALMESAGGRTFAVDDVPSDPYLSGMLARFGVQSLIAAPLVVRGETEAVLVLTYLGKGHRFRDIEVEFLSRVASGLSLALANARLYTGERDVSDSLQKAMLTLPDRLEGVEFAHAYHSASEVARVGGDFCDVFDTDTGLVGLTIGDVAGKGLNAAVLTSLVKNVVRAHVCEKGAQPGAILGLTNDLVFRTTSSDTFVTVFLGVLDREDGRFVYANAGHTTGGLVHAEGEPERLGATGPILGGFHGITFGERETRVEFGDLLFLYTDGLTESRSDHDLFGEDRVFELLARLRAGSPSTVIRDVVGAAMGHAGGRLKDDMALVALRRLGPPEGAPGDGRRGEARPAEAVVIRQ